MPFDYLNNLSGHCVGCIAVLFCGCFGSASGNADCPSECLDSFLGDVHGNVCAYCLDVRTFWLGVLTFYQAACTRGCLESLIVYGVSGGCLDRPGPSGCLSSSPGILDCRSGCTNYCTRIQITYLMV